MSSNNWKFHCAVLSVSEQASAKEIKNAYRKLAQRFHPDHNGGTPQAKEKFQRINASYSYLSKNLSSRPPIEMAHAPKPEPKAKPPWRWANPLQRHAILAASFLFGVLSLGFIFKPIFEIDTQATQPSKRLDDYGRKLNRCELYSFQRGTMVSKEKNELSEVDCNLKCYEWFAKNDELDATCIWGGNEFLQHAANTAQRNLTSASPAIPAPEPVQHSEPKENTAPRFVLDREPEYEGKLPTELRKIRLGEEHVVNSNEVPVVWIGDTRLLHGSAGVNARQVIIKPIRRGVTGVTFMNSRRIPYHKIIYNIE